MQGAGTPGNISTAAAVRCCGRRTADRGVVAGSCAWSELCTTPLCEFSVPLRMDDVSTHSSCSQRTMLRYTFESGKLLTMATMCMPPVRITGGWLTPCPYPFPAEAHLRSSGCAPQTLGLAMLVYLQHSKTQLFNGGWSLVAASGGRNVPQDLSVRRTRSLTS
jgi:hypothetical protein